VNIDFAFIVIFSPFLAVIVGIPIWFALPARARRVLRARITRRGLVKGPIEQERKPIEKTSAAELFKEFLAVIGSLIGILILAAICILFLWILWRLGFKFFHWISAD
jgi:hypothetical protein